MAWERQRTCLWFYNQAEEAARFYVSLVPDSRIESVAQAPGGLTASVVTFTLGGTGYLALDGGPHLRLTEAVPISVMARDQAELDRFWTALVADGGEGGRCGWLRDRFGLSWQILPVALPELRGRAAGVAGARVSQALMDMGRIDVAALQAAFDGGAAVSP